MKKIFRRYVDNVLVEQTLNGVPQRSGLGNRIALVATPIARALRLKCIDPETKQPRPESACGKARARLNAGESISSVIVKRLKGE